MEPDEIILDNEQLQIVGLAVVTAILSASGELDPKKARAEGRRILREASQDIRELRDGEAIP